MGRRIFARHAIPLAWAPAFVLVAAAQAQETTDLLTRVTNAYPAYSPDGTRIAYMSNADGDFDIYVVVPDSGIRRQLTDSPGLDGQPVWSPDGRRIAFRSMRDSHSQIYVMSSDGSDPRNLSQNAFLDEHPVWSTDGQRIFFASERPPAGSGEPNYDLFSMSVDGTDVRRITATPEVETYPAVSPDGTRIACRRILEGGDWEVMILDLEGNDVRNLSDQAGVDGWPAWSPDGTRLVFASERSGSADLWVVNADGSSLRQLTRDPDRDERQPWWSPDGTLIAYAQYVWFPREPFDEASEILEVEVANALEE